MRGLEGLDGSEGRFVRPHGELLVVRPRHSTRWSRPYVGLAMLFFAVGLATVSLINVPGNARHLWAIGQAGWPLFGLAVVGCLLDLKMMKVTDDGQIFVKFRIGSIFKIAVGAKVRAIREEQLRERRKCCAQGWDDYTIHNSDPDLRVDHIVVELPRRQTCWNPFHVTRSFAFTPADHTAEEVEEAYAAALAHVAEESIPTSDACDTKS